MGLEERGNWLRIRPDEAGDPHMPADTDDGKTYFLFDRDWCVCVRGGRTGQMVLMVPIDDGVLYSG